MKTYTVFNTRIQITEESFQTRKEAEIFLKKIRSTNRYPKEFQIRAD